MVEPKGTAQVLKCLAKKGYTEDFKASKHGFKLFPSGIELKPEELLVDEIHRFEGITDLNDEEIIFALSCHQKSLKGTFLVAFGPMMDPIDATIVQRLKKLHDQRRK